MLVTLVLVCLSHFYTAVNSKATRTCGSDEIVCCIVSCCQGQCLNFFHSDWITHQHRDSLASIVGHPTLTSYLAIADGESIGRVKFEMTEVCSFSISQAHVKNNVV